MRRVVSAVLLGLGVALLVTAVLLPTYVAPALVKVPLNQDSQSIAEASGATVLRIPELKEESGVSLQAIRTIKGDVDAGDENRAVFDVFVYVKDTDGKEVTYSSDRVALDRRTAHSVQCCRENVNGKAAKHRGVIYKFPFGTEKKTYDYYDITALKTYPAKFRGVDRIGGIEVYKFEMVAEPVQVGESKLPGTALGATAPDLVTVPRFYSNTRTLWVEPKTGIIIRGREQQEQVFRVDGVDKLTVIKADIGFTEKTVNKNVQLAKDTRAQIGLLTWVLPLTFAILGLLLAGGALVLMLDAFRAGRRRA
jgi:hypothetical protein